MSFATGLLIGRSHRQRQDNLSLQDEVLAPLRNELAGTRGDALFQQAYFMATCEVHEAILEEIRLAGAGELRRAVLSVPTARAARNEAFVRIADEVLQRLSKGQHSLSAERKAKLLQTQPLE